MKKKIQRNRRQNKLAYARGSRAATSVVMGQIVDRKLEPAEGLRLLVVFASTLDSMLSRKDIGPPFLSRAMATALNASGIENYETAFAAIAANVGKRFNGTDTDC